MQRKYFKFLGEVSKRLILTPYLCGKGYSITLAHCEMTNKSNIAIKVLEDEISRVETDKKVKEQEYQQELVKFDLVVTELKEAIKKLEGNGVDVNKEANNIGYPIKGRKEKVFY